MQGLFLLRQRVQNGRGLHDSPLSHGADHRCPNSHLQDSAAGKVCPSRREKLGGGGGALNPAGLKGKGYVRKTERDAEREREREGEREKRDRDGNGESE